MIDFLYLGLAILAIVVAIYLSTQGIQLAFNKKNRMVTVVMVIGIIFTVTVLVALATGLLLLSAHSRPFDELVQIVLRWSLVLLGLAACCLAIWESGNKTLLVIDLLIAVILLILAIYLPKIMQSDYSVQSLPAATIQVESVQTQNSKDPPISYNLAQYGGSYTQKPFERNQFNWWLLVVPSSLLGVFLIIVGQFVLRRWPGLDPEEFTKWGEYIFLVSEIGVLVLILL